MAAAPYQAYGDDALCRPGKRSATRQADSQAKTSRNIVVLPDGGCALSGLRKPCIFQLYGRL